MEFQDIANATVDNFNRYAERHLAEGQALELETEIKIAERKLRRLHVPIFVGHNTAHRA